MSEFREQQDRGVKPPAAAPREQDAGGHDHGLRLAGELGNTHVADLLSSPGVQRAGATSAQQLDESVARAIEDRRGRGQPLSDDVRTEMGGALGHDLSDVRVHTDSTAHQLNEAVSAKAFTTGSDVFFKQGTYDPASSSGRALLAHELTHVAQQRTGTSGLNAGEVSDPSDAAEQHADAVGQAVAGHAAAPPAGAAAPAGVARQTAPDDELEEGVAASRSPDAGLARAAEDQEIEEGA